MGTGEACVCGEGSRSLSASAALCDGRKGVVDSPRISYIEHH